MIAEIWKAVKLEILVAQTSRRYNSGLDSEDGVTINAVERTPPINSAVMNEK